LVRSVKSSSVLTYRNILFSKKVSVPYTHFLPPKIILDFFNELELNANSVFIDIINLKIRFDRECYDVNLNPISYIERWGFVFLWRLTPAVLCKKRVFEVLTTRRNLHFIVD
jgi:hypothetical protein